MKMKKVKRNKYAAPPEAEIDLHGFTREEAGRALRSFLAESRAIGRKKVRVITGQGWHSENNRGVLKSYVETILDGEELDHSEAKINEGGRGAIDVRFGHS